MIVLLHILLLSGYRAVPSSSAPTDTTTSTPTVGWVSDPDGRGTSGLVSSCVLTLCLCVWSAIHLNIPLRNASQVKTLLQHAKWGLTGLFGPELVVYSAWMQWSSARGLGKELRRVFRDQEEKRRGDEKLSRSGKREWRTRHLDEVPEDAQRGLLGSPARARKHQWTMVHSFYAVMGGFVFSPESCSEYSARPLLTLTPRGVALLAECGHLPDISKKDIDDKSKADALAKALVCLQASWMLVQTVGRLAGNLPVTLLEVNTLGHILCAFIIYVLWWNKPRQVFEPTVLEGRWVGMLHAYMEASTRRAKPGQIEQLFGPTIDWLLQFLPKFVARLVDREKNNGPGSATASLRESSGTFKSSPPTSPRGTSEETITDGIQEVEQQTPATPVLDPLVVEAIRHYPAIRARVSSNSVEDEEMFEPASDWLLVRRAKNWPTSGALLPGVPLEVMGMALWTASIAYGGVHIAAWENDFATYAERVMWRLSSVYISCAGVIWFTANGIAYIYPPVRAYWDRMISRNGTWMEYVFWITLCSACGTLYVFSRAFLVIEAFVSLRRLPVAAYDTTNWSEVIPHL